MVIENVVTFNQKFVLCFAPDVSFLMQLLLLRSVDGADIEWVKEVKGNVYDMVVEGFQLLSRWTSRIWEQCAWKFSRPCKDPLLVESNETATIFSDYEKVGFFAFTHYLYS